MHWPLLNNQNDQHEQEHEHVKTMRQCRHEYRNPGPPNHRSFVMLSFSSYFFTTTLLEDWRSFMGIRLVYKLYSSREKIQTFFINSQKDLVICLDNVCPTFPRCILHFSLLSQTRIKTFQKMRREDSIAV